MSNGKFRLLETFKNIFLGTIYVHRNSTLGNKIGREFFEDLPHLHVSPLYEEHVRALAGVVNSGGKIHTQRAIRRNDSVFGRPPAGVDIRPAKNTFPVPEGSVAEPRIGCEVRSELSGQLHPGLLARVVDRDLDA